MASKPYKVPILLTADAKGAVRGIGSMTKAMKKTLSVQNAMNRNMAHSSSLLQGMGAAAAGLSIGAVTKSIIEAGFALDSFNTLLTDNQMEFLVKLTDDLGISLQGSARSFSLLNAAADGTILEGEGVKEVFESMAVASRAFNLSAEDMRGLLRAVEQMMNKGCHGKGSLIRMADGSAKKIEDIVAGDEVMGECGLPKEVVATISGRDVMYEIIPDNQNYPPFVVNQNHKYPTVGKRIATVWQELALDVPIIFLNGKNEEVHCTARKMDVAESQEDQPNYYGIQLSGNHLYLDANSLINHNTVQAEELRGQLSERLPGAFSLTAKAMGVTTQELSKMLEQGEVVATEMLPKLAKALKDKYGDKAEEMSKKGAAGLARFRNELFKLQGAMGQGGIGSSFNNIINDMTGGLKLLAGNTNEVALAMGGLATLMAGRYLNAKQAAVAMTVRENIATRQKIINEHGALIATREASIITLEKARTSQFAAAQTLKEAQANAINTLSSKGAAASTNALMAAKVALTKANKAVAISEAATAAATTASVGAMSRARLIAGGLFALVGGWPMLAIAAGAATYYWVKSMDDFNESATNAIDNAMNFGQQVDAFGDPTWRSAQALRDLHSELKLANERLELNEENARRSGDMFGFYGSKAAVARKEIFALNTAILENSESFQDNRTALIEMLKANREAEDASGALTKAWLAETDATAHAKVMVDEEGAALKRTAEEKWKYTTITKVMKKHTDANVEAVEGWVDTLWDEKEALKAATKAAKEKIKAGLAAAKVNDKRVDGQIEFTASLKEEAEYLADVLAIGKQAADNKRELTDAVDGASAAGAVLNVQYQTEIQRLEALIDAIEDTRDGTEDLTDWIKEEADAYDELFAAANQAEVDAFDIKILEARAQGHEDIATALEIEKDALSQYYAQQGDSIELTKEQIRENLIYEQSLRDQADVVDASAKRQEQIWNNMIDNVQEAWGDLFYGYMEQALMDGEFSFAEFRDNIWKMFIRLLADMASQWAATAIFGGGIGAANSGLMANFSAIGGGMKQAASWATNAYASYTLAGQGAAEGAVGIEAFGGASGTAATEAIIAGKAATEGAVALEAFGGASGSAATETIIAGKATTGLSSGMVGLGAATGVVAVGLYMMNESAKRSVAITSEVTAKMKEADVTVQNAAVTFGRWGDEGVAQLSAVGQETGVLQYAMKELGAELEYATTGAILITEGMQQAEIAATAFTESVNEDLAEMVELERAVTNGQYDYALSATEAQAKVGKAWGESMALINSTDFDAVVKEFVALGYAGETAFRDISKDGLITTQEIEANFGSAADAIIREMDGASAVSVTALLKILGVSATSADGIVSDFDSAASSMESDMVTSADRIQKAIDGLEGTDITSTHSIYETTYRGDGGGGDGGGGGYAEGGVSRGSTSGHLELLHGIEAVVPLPDGRSIPVQMTGAATRDDSEILRLLGIMVEQNNTMKNEMTALQTAVYSTGSENVFAHEDTKRAIEAA